MGKTLGKEAGKRKKRAKCADGKKGGGAGQKAKAISGNGLGAGCWRRNFLERPILRTFSMRFSRSFWRPFLGRAKRLAKTDFRNCRLEDEKEAATRWPNSGRKPMEKFRGRENCGSGWDDSQGE